MLLQVRGVAAVGHAQEVTDVLNFDGIDENFFCQDFERIKSVLIRDAENLVHPRAVRRQLPGVYVRDEGKEGVVAPVGDHDFVSNRFLHAGRQHGPEPLALTRQNSAVGVNGFAFHDDSQI